MATTPDVIRFQELSNKDRILCTTRDHTRYLRGSVEVMELVDEIHAIDKDLCELAGQPSLHTEDLDRSCILIDALRKHRNLRESLRDEILVARGIL